MLIICFSKKMIDHFIFLCLRRMEQISEVSPTPLQHMLVNYFNIRPRLLAASQEAPLFFNMLTQTVVSYSDLQSLHLQATESYRLAYPVDIYGHPDVNLLAVSPLNFRQKLMDIHVQPLPSITAPEIPNYRILNDPLDRYMGNVPMILEDVF